MAAQSRIRANGARTTPSKEALEDARFLQERWRNRVELGDRFGDVHWIGGADVAYDNDRDLYFAAIAVVDSRTLEVLDMATSSGRIDFPYVPGYLSFREVPPLLEAYWKLDLAPDLIVCDGHGYAHPRRFGLACHLGVVLDVPTIGCAKSRLVGRDRQPGARRGSKVQLVDRGEVVGEVVRTRDDTRPVYVSTGHRVKLTTARGWVLRLTTEFRLTQPVRVADAEVKRLRAGLPG